MSTPRRFKVLMVGFCPPAGSISDEFRLFASALPEFVDLTVMCPKALKLDSLPLAELHELAYTTDQPFGFIGPQWFKLIGELRRKQFDAIFYYTQHILNVLVSYLLPSENQILWWHEPDAGGRTTFLKTLLFKIHDPAMAGRSRKIIISCDAVKAQTPAKYHGKLVQIPLPFFQAADLDGQEQDQFVADAVFFGVVHGYKGLAILAQAIDLLDAEGVAITTVAIGKGDMALHCPRLVEISREKPDRVKIWNQFEPYETIANAVKSARCVILPYLSATGTSTIAIAYRQDRPVIATRVGCLPDYVKDGETGWIVEPGDPRSLGDALRFVHEHPEEAVKRGKAGRAVLESRFRGRIVAEALARVFGEGR